MAFSVISALVAWLPEKVGVPCYGQVPETRPESFVDLSRTGGAAQNFVDHPVIAARCWAQSPYEAEELALSVRDSVIQYCGEIPGVHGASVNSGPYDSTESSRQPSMQVVFDISTQI